MNITEVIIGTALFVTFFVFFVDKVIVNFNAISTIATEIISQLHIL